MNGGRLLLICEEADFNVARAFADTIIASWPADTRPKPNILRPADIAALDAQHNTFDVTWLFCGPHFDRSVLYATLDTLEQWRTPVLLTRLDEKLPIGGIYREGIIIGPAQADPFHLCLILQSLCSQGLMIRELKTELAVSKRIKHGLVDQFDRIDEELRLAARIQRQFLPEILPQLPGLQFDVLFRPASYVSGDIYDIQRLDEHTVGFYVADATGHGVPAALMTMFINRSIRGKEVSKSGYRILTPDEALGRLNRDLLNRNARSGNFVTACYGTIDSRSRMLSLCRAGHPPPILLRSCGKNETLNPDGPLLGVFEDEPFETVHIELNPGDRLLVYSDGFEMAFGDNQNPVNQCYVDELHALRHGPPRQAMQLLENKLDEQKGSLHQRDDLTAVMIDIGPKCAA